ncbi:MAG: glycine cleavage system protein H [Acidobacteria bacterium]|nr:glycine cleavage system protein H [Acidobacteriota bacterium]
MTVILVLTTFLIFILVDYFLVRKKAVSAVVTAKVAPRLATAGDYVEGFLVPENLGYHPGHSWLHRERLHVVKIGMDEFSAALAGRIDKIELPKPGHWLRQGQKAWTLLRGTDKAEMVSPIEGEIVEVNSEVVNDPSLLRKDPYGKGWLMTVFVPDEESTGRNLLPKSLVRSWMRNAVEKLYAMQPQVAGAVAADGGRPAEDLFATLPAGTSWSQVAREFFLT